MPTISSSLDSLRQTLAAQQFALSITQRNVANANNENYTRQEAIFADAADVNSCTVTIRALRDRYLDYSVSRESQFLGEQQVASDALQQIDAIMNENGGQGLQKALSDFYNSFNSLSATPEDLTLRQQVLAKATALTSEFHRVSSAIQRVQISQNDQVESTIDEINGITAQIAALNDKIGVAHAYGSDEESVIRDGRQQLVEQLSSLIDISYYETQSGAITVTTRQGGLLVADDRYHVLTRNTLPGTGFSGVQLDGVDITSKLQSGKLAGLIDMRDNKTASYLGALDEMAAAIISQVNMQHTQGIDLDANAGENFFAPFVQTIPGSNAGAAQSICLALSDGRKIAASSSGATGDGKNATLLCSIKDGLLMSSSTETVSQFYAGLIYGIGSDEKNAADGVTSQTNILDQLKNQRAADSGVNLDEEATNIIKYQKAYQASAKFAAVLNTLSDVILSLVGA
jgi:flagellar hook-associated protein 1